MSSRQRDGVYDHNAPGMQGLAKAGYAGVERPGYTSNEERLTSIALAAQQQYIDPALLMQATNPPPEKLFPPRFGYRTDEPGIRDVVQVSRLYPDSSAKFSGSSGSYTGTSTPSLGTW